MTNEVNTTAETILAEAHRLTSIDRQGSYGHPADHHAATATCVEAYLRKAGKLAEGARINAKDWEMFMILDKVMREAGAIVTKRDSLVDICGYARCAEKNEARNGVDGFEP